MSMTSTPFESVTMKDEGAERGSDATTSRRKKKSGVWTTLKLHARGTDVAQHVDTSEGVVEITSESRPGRVTLPPLDAHMSTSGRVPPGPPALMP